MDQPIWLGQINYCWAGAIMTQQLSYKTAQIGLFLTHHFLVCGYAESHDGECISDSFERIHVHIQHL